MTSGTYTVEELTDKGWQILREDMNKSEAMRYFARHCAMIDGVGFRLTREA